MTETIRLVAGLGNPGRRYRDSYHNLGYRAVDGLIGRYDARSTGRRPGVLFEVSEGPVRYLGKPDCFVNRSGSVVSAWTRALDVPPRACLIAYDDFSLEVGSVRLRPSGGPGGHRGLADVIEALETSDVPRLRIGIGPLPQGTPAEEYVLGPVRGEHRAVLDSVLDHVPDMIECIHARDFSAAMNRWNGHRFAASG